MTSDNIVYVPKMYEFPSCRGNDITRAMLSEPQNCFTIQWSIENFSMCLHECGEAILSPHFIEEPSQNQAWYVKLYPGGYHDDDFVAIELCNTIEVCGVFTCTASIIDKCGSRRFERIATVEHDEKCSVFRILYFVEREELFAKKSWLLPGDTLTVQCVVRRPYLLHSIRQSLSVQCFNFIWPIKYFSLITPGYGNAGDDGIYDFARRVIYPLELDFADAPLLHMQFDVRKNSIEESKVYVKFVKRRLDRPTCRVYLTYEISAVRVIDGSESYLFKGRHEFDPLKACDSHKTPVVLLEDRDALVADNTLTLRVELRFTDCSMVPDDQSVTESPCRVTPPQQPSSAFSKNLNEKLYADRKFSDVVIEVGAVSLSAHKSVICAQSEVLRDMIGKGNGGVVRIADVDAVTMKRLLKLLYTGAVDDEDCLSFEDVCELYAAAHKYRVPFLDVVSTVLVSKVTTGNVWKMWSFATGYDDGALKDAVKSFISISMDDIAAASEGRIDDNGQKFTSSNIPKMSSEGAEQN